MIHICGNLVKIQHFFFIETSYLILENYNFLLPRLQFVNKARLATISMFSFVCIVYQSVCCIVKKTSHFYHIQFFFKFVSINIFNHFVLCTGLSYNSVPLPHLSPHPAHGVHQPGTLRCYQGLEN